jgi:ribosomal protein S18 acetylase RimI-like enzyme
LYHSAVSYPYDLPPIATTKSIDWWYNFYGKRVPHRMSRTRKSAREILGGMTFMTDLLQNLDRLHTTELGAERIKRNLALDTDDVVAWCRNAAERADVIFTQGKNWYVCRKGAVITINAKSYTIITAHPLNAKVRPIRESDCDCLREFLYQAIFIPEGTEPPSRDIVSKPEIFVYIRDFGPQPGDMGVVAEQNGQVIGAAWTRIIPAYGHVDDDTPELAISILPEFRGYGIGTKLLKRLFELLHDNGYRHTSLSVQKANPAVRLYRRMGYEIICENDEDYIMVRSFIEQHRDGLSSLSIREGRKYL